MEAKSIEQKIRAWGGKYVLPGAGRGATHLLPVSGGGDSSALAVILHTLFPDENFRMVFTDTHADEPELYDSLNNLEQYLGKKIHRVEHELGLYGLIEKWGGYLPNSGARWCTTNLKLLPFREWMKQFAGQEKFMYVGIRADEPTRLAFALDEVSTEMPLLDMGLKKADVFAVLQATIGIPSFYRRRTRSVIPRKPLCV